MKVLMVLTSHDKLGDTGKKTGFWLEEFAAPYYVLKDAGATITLASPKGGQPPLDPKSDEPDAQTAATDRFKADEEAQRLLGATTPLSHIDPADFDAVFYPGGHGPLWDLAQDKDSIALIENFALNGKPVAAVCHAPGVLRHVKGKDGQPLVNGRKVTGFTNSEEEAVGLTQVVPFLVEDMLQDRGGRYEKGADWGVHVVTDGKLVTGQNPASSEEAAKALLRLMQR
ncbi:type 1 glutamine amidotransferase domain-containing protein [Peteryoungia ipomoeae]|uniref:Type 1 glutamine amidotransferase domain-containing protein n=1 Tax=Peteryoungia ipomoeae TaxID=1210932 RepID=A0A4S8NZD3_9HYPH|nr:type 1 glutamine amidotransferase domain-containing protein [Peteryoungia ipomoeae]THV22958.1 type 1 glutamine amidotransferase domain-containing protein [Peteryoungia ipomoeae]